MTAARQLQRTDVAQQMATTMPVHYPARRAKRKVNHLPRAILLTLLSLGLAMGYVSSTVRVMNMTYTLADLRSELAVAQREYGYLSIAVEKARSPQQVEKLARERLGMVTPKSVEYIVLNETLVEKNDAPDMQQTKPGLVRTVAAWLQKYWPHKATVVAASRL